MSRQAQAQPVKSPDPDNAAYSEALISEARIASEAAEIRGTATVLTKALFDKLYPLLTKPIPGAFLLTVSSGKGKPYASTGIRSVQVQVDRMNNVLSPAWWGYEDSYEEGGKVAMVRAFVGELGRPPLLERSSRGGVDRGSSSGNTYKGSFTNAAKLAIARIGPGHEVYIGAADLDPDVNESVAKEVGGGGINASAAKVLAERAFAVPAAKENLRMAIAHVAETEAGDCSTVTAAARTLTALTFEQAEKVDAWLRRKETEAGIDATDGSISDERVEYLAKGIDAVEGALKGMSPVGTAIDGLNLVLGSLGINMFDLGKVREGLSGLKPAEADALDAELQKLADEQALKGEAEHGE